MPEDLIKEIYAELYLEEQIELENKKTHELLDSAIEKATKLLKDGVTFTFDPDTGSWNGSWNITQNASSDNTQNASSDNTQNASSDNTQNASSDNTEEASADNTEDAKDPDIDAIAQNLINNDRKFYHELKKFIDN